MVFLGQVFLEIPPKSPDPVLSRLWIRQEEKGSLFLSRTGRTNVHPSNGSGLPAGCLPAPFFRSSGKPLVQAENHVMSETLEEFRIGPDSPDEKNRSRVPNQKGVGRDQGQPFNDGLGDENAVKRVFMDQRQPVDPQDMMAKDFQFLIAIVQKTPPQDMGIHLKVRAAETPLDDDFPQACRAEHQNIRLIF